MSLGALFLRARLRLIGLALLESLLVLLATLALAFAFLPLIPQAPLWGATVAPYLAILYLIWRAFPATSKAWMARLLEEKTPELQERLSSWLELQKDPYRDLYSPFLLEKLEAEAETAARRVSLRKALPLDLRPLQALLTAGAFAALLTALRPDATAQNLYTLTGRTFQTRVVLFHPRQATLFADSLLTVQVEVLGFRKEGLTFLLDGRDTLSPAKDRLRLPPLKEGTHRVYATGPDLRTDTLQIRVFRRPYLEDLRTRITPPAYTGLPPEVREQTQYVGALEGSRVEITGRAALADRVVALTDEDTLSLPPRFRFTLTLDHSQQVRFLLMRGPLAHRSPWSLQLDAVPDTPPQAHLIEPAGDLPLPDDERVPVEAEMEDDFGLQAAYLAYSFHGDTVRIQMETYTGAPVRTQLRTVFDLSDLGMLPGDQLLLWVEAEDLKGQRGASRPVVIRFPTLEELYAETEARTDSGAALSRELAEQARALSEHLQKVQEMLKQETTRKLNWSHQEKLREVMESEQELIRQVEEGMKRIEQAFQELQKSFVLDPRLLEKLQEVQKLFQEAMTEELRKALEKLQKALESLDPRLIQKALEELQLNQEALLENLERMEELLRRFKQENDFQRLAQMAERLAQMEEELQVLTRQAEPEEISALARRQESLNQEMETLLQEMEALRKSLESSADSAFASEIQALEASAGDSALQGGQAAEEGLRQGQWERALSGEAQAARSLRRLAQGLQSTGQSLVEKRKQEVLQALRRLRSEGLFLSQQQEALVAELEAMGIRSDLDPLEAARKEAVLQRASFDLARRILDLGRKTMAISRRAVGAAASAAHQMDQARQILENLAPKAALNPARAALAALNLAVLELLRSQQELEQSGTSSAMEQAMEQLAQLAQQQASLNRQTQAMMSAMQGGGMPMPGPGELAMMAAQQEAIRRALEGIRRQIGSEGLARTLEKAQKEMEEVERKLRQGKLDRELIRRQERILTRLLEAQKSIHKQAFSRRRESRPGEAFIPLPPEEGWRDRMRREVRRALFDLEGKNYPPQIERMLRNYYRQLLEAL